MALQSWKRGSHRSGSKLGKVAPDGSRRTITTALNHPTGVTVGPDGAIYVSNNGNLPAVGDVLRIEP